MEVAGRLLPNRELPPCGARLFPEPAHGGRSECGAGADWLAPFGRFEDALLPKPCGARPRSEVFPCADQFLVPLLAGRFAGALPFTEARPLTLALAEGGRLLESSRCRADIEAELPAEGEFAAPLRAPNPPELFTRPVSFTRPVLFTRPAESVRVSIVRTGMCEAAAPGAVRAITERLVTEAGGVATRPRALAAPVKLLRVGEKFAPLLTRALRSEASVMCAAPRFTACPFTNVLREAAVTARALLA